MDLLRPNKLNGLVLISQKPWQCYGNVMARNRNSISKEKSYSELGKFWDTHDFTDYDDPACPDVEMTFSGTVAIEAELLASLNEQAVQRGGQSKRWSIFGCNKNLPNNHRRK